MPPANSYTIVIKPAAWYAACDRAGFDTEAAKAMAFRVSRATIARIHAGGTVGTHVIAAALIRIPRSNFVDLFEIVR